MQSYSKRFYCNEKNVELFYIKLYDVADTTLWVYSNNRRFLSHQKFQWSSFDVGQLSCSKILYL